MSRYIRPLVPELANPEVEDVDKAWCSETSKNRIKEKLLVLLKGNLDCFDKFDVKPLYSSGPFRCYRVVIYVKDLSWEGFMPRHKIWGDYFVCAKGADSKIVEINPPIH
jgi:hypothetical protein